MTTRRDYKQWAATSDKVYDACLLFEVSRRSVYKHLGWLYNLPLPARHDGVEPLLWVKKYGDCERCNGRHVRLTKQAYFTWLGYLPVECQHEGVLETIRVDPDQTNQNKLSEIIMPLKVVCINPETASISSGGIVTSLKLQADLNRVEREADRQTGWAEGREAAT